MKLETFFEKFDQFAEAPNAVAKMRELVLQLAVQGKLVEQSPADGTATDLIKCSINERNRLVKEKRIRNSQSITPVGEFNTPGSLPKSWAWTTLAEISLINPRNDVEDDALATFIPMPGIPQNYRGPFGGEIRPWGEIKKAFTHFADGDIALAKITPCFQNGKSAVFRGLKNGIGAGTTELHVARPVGGPVLPEYVWIFLKSPLFITEGIPAMTGSAGQKRIPTGYFALKPFPLPPLAEQKRIVAKVDELMALCDRLETQQQDRDARHASLVRASLTRFADAPTTENLNLLFHPSYAIAPADLHKTILTLAVQGKLAPASETKHVVLGEVIELISGQHLLAHEHNKEGKGIPYLTGPSDFGARHPNPTRWTETPKVAAEPGDILITVKGAGVGKTNKLVAERTAISRQLMAVRVTRADPDFIHLVLMDSADHFQSSMTGIAIPGIGRKNVLELKVELPPLAEQRQVVAKVDQLMALVDQLEAQLTASRTAAANLMEAVVAELAG